MATVRCPTCGRLLKLPDEARGDMARCPLCQTDFPAFVGGVPLVLRRTAPVSAPAAPAAAPPSSPFDFGAPAVESLPAPLRHDLATAVRFLKVHAGLGILHLFLCNCLCIFGEPVSRFAFILAFTLVVLRAVALVLIYSGAEALERGRQSAMATTAGVLALMTAAWLVVVAVCFNGMARRQEFPVNSTYWMSTILFAALVAVLGLVGGVKTLVLMGRPEVARWFRR